LEKNVYALPDLNIGSYRVKIREAIAEIYARYEDLGIAIDPYFLSLHKSELIRYRLEENILVLFKIADNKCSAEIKDFAEIERVSEKEFTVTLQKDLFQEAPEKITAVVQLKLDETIFFLQGHSFERASNLAMQAYQKYPPPITINRGVDKSFGNEKLAIKSEEDNNKIEDHFLKVVFKEKTPKISQAENPKNLRRGGRRKKEKPPSNPGKEVLEALIINYGGNLEEMKENPNINTNLKTLDSWIHEEGLYELVEQLRRAE